MNTTVLRAVFVRNFGSYFASPTGYVFICVFVLLSAFAAFWPNEFFNANLANLDQLNRVFPFIMLIFIPAITMSTWAEERREGTDELLLTIPAYDLDIVLGKYLAAVAILSVALVFSMFSNYLVFITFLGYPDVGLFLGTYIGYWMVGVAMLAVGMVASFLTRNITVAYVLGAVFNAPLVFAATADVIFGQDRALLLKAWSIGGQFRDFGRGVLSTSGAAYFLAIVVVMLYLCMVLIARRHWVRGRGVWVMSAHYLVRALALAVIAVAANVFLQWHDARLDVTTERLSSLSPTTRALLTGLKLTRPIQIDAFISPEVPETYVQARLDLISMLREIQARGGEKVRVTITDTDRFSQEAARAEQRYGITARQVTTISRGAFTVDQIFMGLGVTCGLEKVILPFIDRGIPVEYELVRSISTVAQQKPRTIGVLKTDAPLYGRFDMQTMSPPSNWPIIDELEKQYNVVQVDPTQPITQKYDVLLAVQPSSLGPAEMERFLDVIKRGQPTAVFEDPFPAFAMDVPATSAPRRPPGGMNMMMMGRQELPKGDVNKLWDLLGIDMAPDQIIWQDYNPYPKVGQFYREFVFTDAGCGNPKPFSDKDVISSGLQQMLFPFPGAITKRNTSDLQFTPLVRTGDKTGTVRYNEILQMNPFGMPAGLNEYRRQIPTAAEYTLAVHVQGELKTPEGQTEATGGQKKEASKEKEKKSPAPPVNLNVVVVADIDMLSREFFRLREQGDMPEAGIHFDFDNVTFILNALDSLAGDERFLALRKRRPQHRTLVRIEQSTEEARKKTAEERERLTVQFDRAKDEEQAALQKKLLSLKERKNIDPQQLLIEVAIAQQEGQRRLDTKVEQLKRERETAVNKIETELAVKVAQVQNRAKMWAVFAPPVPALLLALGVYLTRRAREREGVARSRLRG